MKEIDAAELAAHNGQAGSPAYIAHEGAVYDVTASKLWRGGIHMQRHHAGSDLTADIQAAPHGVDVLARYPQVAVLMKEETTLPPMPEPLSRLLRRHPFLIRHPHPMVVHFPIALMFSTTIFTLLYLLTGIEGFEITAFNCLGFGLLGTMAGMATGYATWWLNYRAKPLRPVTIKQVCSAVLLAFGLIAFLWRVADPGISHAAGPAGVIYLLLVCSLLPLVAVIGWYGATLTFPFGREGR